MTPDIVQDEAYFQQLANQSQKYTRQLNLIHDFSYQLADFLAKGWWLHVVQLIDEKAKQLPGLAFLDVDLERITAVGELARQEAQREQRRFPRLFEDACQKAGIPLDASPHPRYTTDNHFIKIIIDDRKKTAKIENYLSELVTLPMDVGAVVHELVEVRARLFGREFDAGEFIERLFHDYRVVTRSEKIKDGEAVSIRSITKRRGKNVKGFRVDEFSVDLSRLLEDGLTTTKDRYRLRLEQTKNTNQGIMLPGGHGYIGFIRFER